MADKVFYNSLARLGFPMFEPDEELHANETLAKVVESKDSRLWEGFPVLLINAAENYQFSPDLVKQNLDSDQKRHLFHLLILLSVAVYTLYHLSFPWVNKFKKTLSGNDKVLIKQWRNCLTQDQMVQLDDFSFNPERVKRNFELYFENRVEKDRIRIGKYNEFSLEYALSQVFSPKQKELFKKKLEGALLNKTEKEYYSRTVKKKVVALANSELHNLSRKLLEQ